MLKIIFLGGEDVSARIDISKKLIDLGCEVEIMGSECDEIFAKNNICYTKIKLNREFNILDDIKTIFSIRKILKNKRKEVIVHVFDTKLTMFLPIASIGLRNIKIVRTINGMGRLFSKNKNKIKNNFLIILYKLIHKLIQNKVHFTIFQNTDNYKFFLKNKLVKEYKSKVIKSSGINLDKFSNHVEDQIKLKLRSRYIKYKNSLTFIVISRLIIQKGIINFLEAAKLCHNYGYKFNFLLVGQIDTNEDAVSYEQINKYKKYVNYLGRQTNIKEILSISDIFVLPTYYSEGIPRVLLEASAMSLALLTTNMPGCNDVLLDGKNGFFVNANDSNDLFKKMKYLGDNKSFLKTLKINSLKHVKNFSLEKVLNESFEIYKHVSTKKKI